MGVLSGDLRKDTKILNQQLAVGINFDVVSRNVIIGGTEAAIYFIDGFCKDDLMQKMLQFFMEMQTDSMPKDAVELLKKAVPYVEVNEEKDISKIQTSVLYIYRHVHG